MPEQKREREQHRGWQKPGWIDLVCGLLLTAAGGALLTLFSSTTSPLFPGYYGTDSATFQLGGRIWANGGVMYRDFFDHKGPFIFFVDMLGEKLWPDRTGIFVLQIVFLGVSLYFLYRTARLALGVPAAFAAALLSGFYVFTWEGDGCNVCEDYCLPFLAAAFYLLLRWLQTCPSGSEKGKKAVPHPPAAAFVYGLAFGIGMMTRMTNGFSICAAVACVVVYLIAGRQWANLGWNALAFTGGTALACVPFLLYFAAKGALGDMLFATFTFNFEYLLYGGTTTETVPETAWVLRALLKSLPVWLTAAAGVWLLARRRAVYGVTLLVTALATMALVLKMNVAYQHYQIVNLPFLAVGTAAMADALRGMQKKTLQRAGAACTLAALAVCAAIAGNTFRSQWAWKDGPGRDWLTGLNSEEGALLQSVPAEDRDSVAGFNIQTSSYLAAGVMPCYKYTVLLNWQMKISPRLRAEVTAQYASCRAKWVLTSSMKKDAVQAILDEHYEVVQKVDTYTLYRLKEGA